MQFIRQYEKGIGNWGTYFLTFSISIFALFLGNIFILAFIDFNPDRLLDGSFDKNTVLTLQLLPFALVLLALMMCIRFLHRRPILSLFTSRERFDWKRFFLSFVIWGGIMTVFMLVDIGLGAPIQWNLNWESFLPLVLISLFILPLQTTAEEALFRGYLFQAFGSAFKHGGVSILITGTLFGLLHGANPEVQGLGTWFVVFFIVSGIFLGILTHMDDGMELGMGYHAVNNIFAALILTNEWQAIQTDALLLDKRELSFSWDIIISMAVILPSLLLLYGRIYRWKNWKQKLFRRYV